eukprot:5263970-Prymnesium_polylepis.1
MVETVVPARLALSVCFLRLNQALRVVAQRMPLEAPARPGGHAPHRRAVGAVGPFSFGARLGPCRYMHTRCAVCLCNSMYTYSNRMES